MMRRMLVAIALLIAACGGGGGGDTPDVPDATPTVTGTATADALTGRRRVIRVASLLKLRGGSDDGNRKVGERAGNRFHVDRPLLRFTVLRVPRFDDVPWRPPSVTAGRVKPLDLGDGGLAYAANFFDEPASDHA